MTPEQAYAICPTLPYGATAAQAADYVRVLVRRIGIGFHPDTVFTSYVDANGAKCFTTTQAAHLQRSLDRVIRLIGDDVFDIGSDEQHKLAAELGIA